MSSSASQRRCSTLICRIDIRGETGELLRVTSPHLHRRSTATQTQHESAAHMGLTRRETIVRNSLHPPSFTIRNKLSSLRGVVCGRQPLMRVEGTPVSDGGVAVTLVSIRAEEERKRKRKRKRHQRH